MSERQAKTKRKNEIKETPVKKKNTLDIISNIIIVVLILAVLGIGYADGFPRTLSAKGNVIINGKLAPIVGRVCMDQTVVDVSDVDCTVGDVVTIIGKDDQCEITADDIALLDDTINYEILCRISPRVPRVYVKDGQICNITKYV